MRISGITICHSTTRAFGVRALDAATAFVPLGTVDLDRILCLEDERMIAPDNTVVVAGRILQIERQPGRRTCAGMRVVVRQHLAGGPTAVRLRSVEDAGCPRAPVSSRLPGIARRHPARAPTGGAMQHDSHPDPHAERRPRTFTPPAVFRPADADVTALIAAAAGHPLGLDYLLQGHLGTVAITFGCHAFVVAAARDRLVKGTPGERPS
jgi:hypothetical protein